MSEPLVYPDQQGIIVYPQSGTTRTDCIEAARLFCQTFRVKYVVTVHNDTVLQVNQHGLVPRERRPQNGTQTNRVAQASTK